MSSFYMRRDPDAQDTLGAVCAAMGAGIITFYVARSLLARDTLVRESPERDRPIRGARVVQVLKK